MKRVALVDYGVGNLDSVRRALEEAGARPEIAARGADLRSPDAVVLPGVGSFSEAMRRLRERGLADALEEEVKGRGAPFLGICLGMQLMAGEGTEGGNAKGLGWVAGRVERLTPAAGERVPHVGWNEVRFDPACPLGRGVPDGTDFYFTHSFHVAGAPAAATTPFAGGLVSAVGSGAVFGVQFHPEKSQRAGLAVLKNFLAL